MSLAYVPKGNPNPVDFKGRNKPTPKAETGEEDNGGLQKPEELTEADEVFLQAVLNRSLQSTNSFRCTDQRNTFSTVGGSYTGTVNMLASLTEGVQSYNEYKGTRLHIVGVEMFFDLALSTGASIPANSIAALDFTIYVGQNMMAGIRTFEPLVEETTDKLLALAPVSFTKRNQTKILREYPLQLHGPNGKFDCFHATAVETEFKDVCLTPDRTTTGVDPTFGAIWAHIVCQKISGVNLSVTTTTRVWYTC